MRPVDIYPVDTLEPIDPDWVAIVHAIISREGRSDLLEGFGLWFLTEDGRPLAYEQFDTLEIALDQANAIAGIPLAAWRECHVELPEHEGEYEDYRIPWSYVASHLAGAVRWLASARRGRSAGPLAATMTRQTEQLLATANHYLAEAKRVLAKDPSLATLPIGEITRRRKRGTLSPSEVVLAHFGSAAVRLATVCEMTGYQPTENYRRKFYETSGKRKAYWSRQRIAAKITANPHEHLHILLRDNVAHEEPGIANNEDIAADRFAVLKGTSIDTCGKALETIARRLKGGR